MSDRQASIKVMVVDDHPVVRHGLVSFVGGRPGFTVVAEAESGEEAIRLFGEHRPDVTLMDLRLPGIGGVETIERIRVDFPDARFVVLTTFDGDDGIYRALEAGAQAYVLKSIACEELAETIRQIHSGQRRIPEAVAQKLAERMFNPVLTPRELDVLRLVARGASNKDVASALGVSPGTAKTHLTNIFRKLGAVDRTSATTIAIERGLIRLDTGR
jgi:DNA-binding NarL/FixJ family response regulator